MKFLKDNLPWIAPTVAIAVIGGVFLQRQSVAIALNTPAPVAEVAVVAADFIAPEPATIVQAVDVVDTSTAARLAALVDATAETPEVTRSETAPLLAPTPEVVVNGVGTGAEAAAFFANAQANLVQDSS